jgi:hypothetical protein
MTQMNEAEPNRGHDAKVPQREPYALPRLVRHGTIEELTRGAVPGLPPGDAASIAP